MNDFLRPANGRRPWITAVAVLIVVAIIFGGILFALSGQGTEDQTFPTPTISSEPPSQTSTAAPTEGEALQLVSGRRRVSGVAIGYPHSVAGAVSAAVEIWSQAGATLNPDRAAAIGRLVADASWTDAPDEFAAGPKNTRRSLGLPASGDPGPGASISVEASAYQLRNKTSDRVTVLLLGYLNTTSRVKEARPRSESSRRTCTGQTVIGRSRRARTRTTATWRSSRGPPQPKAPAGWSSCNEDGVPSEA